jgi:acyl-CoA thioesterase-1
MTEEHVLNESARDVLFSAQYYFSPDAPSPVKTAHVLPALIEADADPFLTQQSGQRNRSSMLGPLPVSSHRPSRKDFGLISRAFQLRQLLVILLILGWALPAQFIELAQTSHTASIESSGWAKPLTYLALGDSTGLGLGAKNGYGYVDQLMTRIKTEHPGARLVKLCRLGETTSSLLQRLTETLSVKPSFVTLSIGMNDILQQISEQEFSANYEAIVKRLGRLVVPIVITNLPDISFAPRIPNSMRKEMHVRVLLFNKQIKVMAKRYALLFVDLYAASEKMIATHPDFFSSDGFHPSDAGYGFWTLSMWPTVKIAIKRSPGVTRGSQLHGSRIAQESPALFAARGRGRKAYG